MASAPPAEPDAARARLHRPAIQRQCLQVWKFEHAKHHIEI
jgi:hypothetical protein